MRCAGCSVTKSHDLGRKEYSPVGDSIQEMRECDVCHLRNPISARTVQKELHASNLYGRVGIRTSKEAFAPECIVLPVKHGVGSLMVWGDIFGVVLGHLLLCMAEEAAHNVNILGDQVHPFVQTSFPGECPLYQDDNAPIHTAKNHAAARIVSEHEGSEITLIGPLQSPDLNIIEHLWGYLSQTDACSIPSTIYYFGIRDHHEDSIISCLFYASIPRRMQSVIQSKGVQLPYIVSFSPLSQVFVLQYPCNCFEQCI
ncbi:transposable element Tcb1 transposase [Trichonephila clavipes]|nr:transposable element Tcb1 transposase [Trichonephila clavipes]